MDVPRKRLFFRAWWWALAAGAVAAVTASAWWWATRPTLPAVDLAGADPAVVEAVEARFAAVRAAPRSDAAWGALGMLLLAHDYLPEAATCFAEAGRLNPSEPRWPALRAVALRRSDPGFATALYDWAIGLSGGASDVLEPESADLKLERGLLDQARWRYDQILHRRPDDARAQLGLARIALSEDDLAGSLDHLNRALDDPHTRKSATRLLAEVREHQGEAAAARQAAGQAEQAPDDLAWPAPFGDELDALIVGKDARLRRIQDLERQGRHDDAAALSAKVEDQYPDVYWLVEGRARQAHGRWREAEEALRQAVGFNPASIDAQNDLGVLLMKRKQYEEAARCFEEVTAREPGHGLAYNNLGLCRTTLGDRPAALKAFRQAALYAPFRAETHRNLGELLLQEGQRDEAVIQLRKTLELQPDDEAAKDLLRQALTEPGP